MPLWKSLILVAVVTAAYFFARPYFPYIALAGGVLWLTQYFRPKPVRETTDLFVAARLADLLGLPRHPRQRVWKFRRDETVYHLSVASIAEGSREVVVVDVATPLYRETPFCFVMRSRSAKVREADLVENSRIPDVRFEYQLRRMPTPDGIEAASNMPDLFQTTAASDSAFSPYALFSAKGIELEKVYFNGRVLHSVLVLSKDASRYDAEHLLHLHTGFHLTLRDIVDNVSFKVPV